jgi:RimJ/RimL family protein N-acetyltransferase
MALYLETERILLRRLREHDATNLFALDGDPDVMRFINGGAPTPLADIQQRILPWFLGFYEQYDSFGFWAAVRKSDGAFVGWFGLHPEDGRDPLDLALGWRLIKSAWGKGYATEVATALVGKAFAELGAMRVFACTYSENLASRRVMEKAGLKFIRSFRMGAGELAAPMTYAPTDAVWPGDDVEYAAERRDWIKPAPK